MNKAKKYNINDFKYAVETSNTLEELCNKLKKDYFNSQT
jgi:hypothetical protein